MQLMPVPWLTALKAVPWTLLLKNAPQIGKAADSLASRLRTRNAPQPVSDEFRSIEARIAALEEHDLADAQVVKQMAEQIQALTTNSAILAARLRLVTFVAAGLAMGVLVLVVVMWLKA